MTGRLLVVLALATAPLAAQAGTEIWIADVVERDGTIALTNLTRVTNRPGYDNQPHFTVEGDALLYSSIRNGQSDIWRYHLATGRHTQVTRTPESEYSPSQQPEGHGRLAVVRVEMDSTQRIWTFAPDGTDFQVLAPELREVGYYAWFPDGHLIAFTLGSPPKLELVDLQTGARHVIIQNIGPTLYVVPEDPSVLFVARSGEETQLVAWSPSATEPLALGALPGGPYFVLDPGRELVLAPRGGEIVALAMANPAAGYTPVPGLEGRDLTGITRLTLSLDGRRLAFVVAEPD